MFTVIPTGTVRLLLACLLASFLFSPIFLRAEGTPNLRSPDGDPVMLLIGDQNFGDFASYDGPENSRLNFRVASVGETVYLGFSRLYKNSGLPESFGQFEYRIRRVSDGAVVFGPITVNSNNENLSSYEQAAFGPSAVNTNGYPVDENSTFTPEEAGEYFVEFEQNRARRPRYIGLWDITVVADGRVQPGRVYSRNWAFRVPELEPQLPECAFGAELSAVFYSYTSDGFVTMIDFRDSGFQPLSFNLAFNRTGPGTTGDLALDRQSIPEANATDNSAEHLIFLEEPDLNLFPDGACGEVSISGQLLCQANETFCIPVEVTLPGQVEIVLDFDGNGVFDEGLDRLLVYRFEGEEATEACVPWDGLLGNGSRPEEGQTVDMLVEYTQGVQHWALYDGELMRNGFCVTPIRPICGNGANSPLYYDDSNIPDDPGTGAPKKVLTGCDCSGETPCRTWTNFEANATDDCVVVNENTTGYGDRNTLNTWWFASSRGAASFDVPVDVAQLRGPVDHCPGESVLIELTYNSPNEVASISWTGPDGPIEGAAGQESLEATNSGLYQIVVTDEFGCESTAEYVLMDVSCSLAINLIGIRCDDNGTDTDPTDDVFYADVRVEGANSAGWIAEAGQNGSYGDLIELGPFPISEGDVTFAVTDGEYGCCTDEIIIQAPMACSDGCAITVANITGTFCDDNGTPTDPSDDTFTFEIIIEGINLGETWSTDRGQSGAYGVVNTFGPFLIADGPQNFQFTDSSDSECVLGTTVQPPMTCSDQCELMPKVENLSCDDAGTPYDPSDDTYSFDLSVEGINAPSVGYSINGAGAYLYDQTNSFGPFAIVDADFSFSIEDLAGADCNTLLLLDPVPTTCSDACGLEIADILLTCVEAEGSTERLFIEILVNSLNPQSRGWITADGQEGGFGEYVRVGTIPNGGATRSVSIRDLDVADCTASASITSEPISVDCPGDADSRMYELDLQGFSAGLSTDSEALDGTEDLCWLPAEQLTAGSRYQERLTILVPEDLGTAPRLLSFYLYAEVDAELRGAVFSQRGEEVLDCCNLTNDGPVTPQPTHHFATPILPDSISPDLMRLQQRFSVVLRPGEIYTLVTSTLRVGEEANFRWEVVGLETLPLIVGRPNGPNPVVTRRSTLSVFDLLNHEIPTIFGRSSSVDEFGRPTVGGACGPMDIAFNDEESGTCVSARIERTFRLEMADTSIQEVCTQVIEARALSLNEVAWPEHFVQFSCTDSYPQLENGHPAPSYTGYPFVYRSGVAVALDGDQLDNLSVRYEDAAERRPDGGLTVFRTWIVTDECRNDLAQYTQTFKLESSGQPFFSCPISNHYCPIVEEDIMLFSTNHFDCFADIEIPAPELNNVCDTSSWTFRTEVRQLTPAGDTITYTVLEDGDDRLLVGVPPGDYLIHFTGSHPEESIEDRYCRIRVADRTEPVAVCKEVLNLSLPGNGVIMVPFQVVDQGSYDNCELVGRQLRRRLPEGHPQADSLGWSAWDGRIFFECEDVGLGQIEVQLLVTDAAGNTNYCTSYVTVLDNTDPYCIGLDPVTVSCSDLPDNFNPADTTQLRMIWGMPEVVDNCSAAARELVPEILGDICSPERIRRRFQAIDQHGNFSTGLFFQDITVVPSLEYEIQFPRDAITDCTDLVDTLRVISGGCDSITYTFEDTLLPTEGEECRYLERSYVVTNWCEWDGESPAIELDRDEDCNGSMGDTDVWLVRSEAGIFVDADGDATNEAPAAASRGADCGDPNPEGYWRSVEAPGGRYVYRQRIKIFDTIAPAVAISLADTVCVDTNFCRIPVTAGIILTDACQVAEGNIIVGIDFNNNGNVETNSEQSGELEGVFPEYSFTNVMPIGEHRFIFIVTDDCGNTTSVEKIFRVNDCYVPFLQCRSDQIYNLQPLVEVGDIDNDGVVEEAAVLVEAIDLARCDFPDCSGDLIYSVNRIGDTVDINQQSIYLDCEDRYEVYLEVYVWDDAYNPFAVQPDGTLGGRNWRKCEVLVRLQDPNLACNDCQVATSVTVNGRVNSLSGQPMTNVLVSAGADLPTTRTGGFGSYQFGGNVGDSYLLQASLETDPRMGLSTLDLLLLRRYILGYGGLDSPYLRLAADLNEDGNLDAQDMIYLQALILGRRGLYPTGPSWRFVAADWDGSGPAPESIQVELLEACSYDHDFVGIRMGDLNDSWGDAAGATNLVGNGRGRPIALLATDRSFEAGETVVLQFQLQEGTRFAGGQAALEWSADQLSFVGVESADLREEENFRTGYGHLWLSWSQPLRADALMTLTFTARTAGKLSEVVDIAETGALAAEVYATDLTEQPLFLQWETAGAVTAPDREGVEEITFAEGAHLLGVVPNPVGTLTRLGVRVTTGQRAQLFVRDINGRVLLEQHLRLVAGEQWLPVEAAGWPPGVYVLQLETDQGIMVHKITKR
ncbi:T9SS type A sorting domain-containing protein [Lewinella sp. W8]|uniref:T9SS type A sorting domain-containing protein n=1 Tax=Lewinella sp. W8 TaxID=2528208 RepID=UPI001067CD1B|nr:T9SS type A sorting domain-containing protein [Lewinella sp. W8]MTB52890.1 T9SS type A sorting domain-containing protein [Lewinella sp. W8]